MIQCSVLLLHLCRACIFIGVVVGFNQFKGNSARAIITFVAHVIDNFLLNFLYFTRSQSSSLAGIVYINV